MFISRLLHLKFSKYKIAFMSPESFPINVAIVGATGEVGQRMLSFLEERNFPGELRVFASERSAGSSIYYKGTERTVENLELADISDTDIALFSAGASVSREFAPRFAASNTLVIDNSSAWRKDPEVPLIVSEVNPEMLTSIPKGIIANPNCTTMIAMPALKPLDMAAGLSSFTAATYQAVSGAGRKGIDELGAQLHELGGLTDELVSGVPSNLPKPQAFAAPIAFNVVPVNGDWEGDETTEELKLRHESRKILQLPRLAVAATCVRVPVVTGHSMAIHARFEKPLSPAQATEILQHAPGVELSDMPTPLEAVGKDVSLVGRIRKDETQENCLILWVAGDNLRKGAALNAIQIAELVLPGLLDH